ncbi:hypothetical protein ACKGJN_07840 [Gillisia sp. Q332]|uniref:hypothetical protein n=1 Tax=Gillisia xinjiangensis TaxID=3384765 RepID=UPI00391A7305
MTDNFTFLNEHLILPIFFGAAILVLVFIWKEWSQSGKYHLAIKVLLAFLAIFSLILIALKPAIPGNINSNKVVLLTDGFEDFQLDSLKKAHKGIKQLEYDLGQLISEEISSAENVFILGHGLKKYDLWQLDEVPVKFLAGNPPEGIVKLNYEQENFVGDNLVLKGLYSNPKSGNRLILQNPAGTGLDSLVFNAEEKQPFLLSAELKVEGRYLFSLLEKDSLGEMLTSDPVPVKVAEKEHLQILIINSFPTFETRYLKNFLSEAGHRVTVRSQITTGRYKYEYFNTDRSPLGNLTENNLESFDLLIIDAASLRSLPGNQISAIENSVRENGLGVFIQADDGFFKSPGISDLDFERITTSDVSLEPWPGIKLSVHPYTLKDDFGMQAIHATNNMIWSGYKRNGSGRMGTSVFTNTYQLLLDGHSRAYKQLWSQVVEHISRKENTAAEWESNQLIAYKDEPFNFRLRTVLDSVALKNQDGNTIPLMQDVDFPTLLKGTTWPKQSGWKSLQADTSGIFEYYVSEESHWRVLTAFNTLEDNRRYFNRPEIAGQGSRPSEPINPLWFFGLFLICMGGLWLEPKL